MTDNELKSALTTIARLTDAIADADGALNALENHVASGGTIAYTGAQARHEVDELINYTETHALDTAWTIQAALKQYNITRPMVEVATALVLADIHTRLNDVKELACDNDPDFHHSDCYGDGGWMESSAEC